MSAAAVGGRVAAAAVLLVAAWTAASAEPLTVRTWPLDERTTAALVEDHRTPIVELRLVFPAGSWSPWVRRTGAGEAFELQLRDPAGELRARADRLAARLVVTVGQRSSTLRASCLKEDLPRVLELVRDVLTHRDFDRRERRRRTTSRRIDWQVAMKSPGFRAARQAAHLLFGADDPRRRDWEKPVAAAAGLERLVAARDRLVRLPGRVAAVAGDLRPAEVERAAALALPAAGDEPPPPADLEPDLGAVTPREARPGELTVPLRGLTQVYFSYCRDSLPVTDPDYPALLVADHVLGGHFYSRLSLALRHEGGETYGAGTAPGRDVVVAPYRLRTFTRAPNADATEARLREVLRVFHRRGIDADERESAIGHLLGRRPFARQSAGQVLDRHLRERELGLASGALDVLVDRAAATSLEEINRFIARFYDPAAFSMIRVAPREGSRAGRSATQARRLGAGSLSGRSWSDPPIAAPPPGGRPERQIF